MEMEPKNCVPAAEPTPGAFSLSTMCLLEAGDQEGGMNEEYIPLSTFLNDGPGEEPGTNPMGPIVHVTHPGERNSCNGILSHTVVFTRPPHLQISHLAESDAAETPFLNLQKKDLYMMVILIILVILIIVVGLGSIVALILHYFKKTLLMLNSENYIL